MALVTFKPSGVYQGFSDALFPFVFDKTNVPAKGPATNIFELENEFVLEMRAPGLSKEEFKISVENDLLSISYEKGTTNQDTRKTVRREFTQGNFKRSFSLDDSIDADNISARYENGILYLTLPKKAEVKPAVKQISIN